MPNALRFQAALALLVGAHQYDAAFGCDAWQFAVEIAALPAAGLTNSDLHWLLLQAYAEQAPERTADGDSQRVFGPPGSLRPGDGSCFVMTRAGLRPAGAGAPGGSGPPRRLPPAADPARPAWDKDRRALWFGTDLVKAFKVPARTGSHPVHVRGGGAARPHRRPPAGARGHRPEAAAARHDQLAEPQPAGAVPPVHRQRRREAVRWEPVAGPAPAGG